MIKTEVIIYGQITTLAGILCVTYEPVFQLVKKHMLFTCKKSTPHFALNVYFLPYKKHICLKMLLHLHL